MTADRQHFDYIWGDGLTLEADIDKPSQVEIEAGWSEGKPKRATANWVENRQDEMLAHIEQNGVPRWDTSTGYTQGAFCLGSDNKLYQSQQANSAQDPTTDDGTYWVEFSTDLSSLGTMSTQDSDSVTITGGSVSGITD